MSRKLHLLMLAVALLAILLVLCLTSCSSKQSKYQVNYMKGCAVSVTTETADSAQQIAKDMNVQDCEMDVKVKDSERQE